MSDNEETNRVPMAPFWAFVRKHYSTDFIFVLGLTTGAGVWLIRHGIEFFQSVYQEGTLSHLLE